MAGHRVGRSPSLALGQGRFVDDEFRPGMLHMVVLRAPVAHGTITRLGASNARQMPGVHAILTAAELEAAGVGPMRLRAPLDDPEDGIFHEPRRPVLAERKVVYVGQPVAAIVASSLPEAQDAAEAIVLDIEEHPAIYDPLLAGDGPQIWPDVPQNTAFRWQTGDRAKMDVVIASAAHVVQAEIRHPRVCVSPIEPRGCLAEPGANGHLVLTTPSQGVVSLRTALSTCLGIAPETLRVCTHDVGGSFAVKIWPYPEHVLALVAARQLGRPVKWIGTRSEAFTGDAAGRARVDRGTLALDSDGRFLAFRIEAVSDMGAFLNAAAPAIVTINSVRPYNQAYDIPALDYRTRAVLTNAPPVDAYRGAGKPESAATLERLIDMAAVEIGIPPFELRRQNLIRPEQLPYMTGVGEVMDSGDFPALAARIAELGDLPGYPERHAESARSGFLRGRAITFHVHATGGATTERSEVRAMPDGTVRVRTGTQDSGQGHRDSLALVVAGSLQIPVDRVLVEQGDSAWLEIGGGTGGSNLTPVAATTVHRTARAMIEQAMPVASELLEAARQDVEYGHGAFRVSGTDRSVSLAAVATEMEERENHCLARLDFEGVHTTWPNGVGLCEVEVDPDTGRIWVVRLVTINDLGEIVNEPAALGQIHGGIAQGIGEVLSEGMRYDLDGQPLTASLLDYALPRADDVPPITSGWAATPSPNSVIGSKGVGELPSNGTPGLVHNAVMDALALRGVRHVDKPLTPSRIWQALQR